MVDTKKFPMSKIDELVDRERGILTPHDRRYLLDKLDKGLSDNAEYQKRHQIRNRIRNAVLDFQIIQGQLSFKDIELLFESTHNWARDARLTSEKRGNAAFPDYPTFVNCWSAMIQFFVFGQLYSQINESLILVRDTIEHGIKRALREYGFEFTNEYYETDVSLQLAVENRYRLLNYIEQVENKIPSNIVDAEEYLFNLYLSNYLTYTMYIYLREKHLE